MIGPLASGLGGWRMLHSRSACYTAFFLRDELLAYRKSTVLPKPTLTFTRVSSSIVLVIGAFVEW